MVDPLNPRCGERYWGISDERCVLRGGRAPRETRPAPIARRWDQPRTDRVAFDVTKDPEQVRVHLNGKRFVSALPDVPGRHVSAPVPLRVSGEKPVHPSGEIIIRSRAHHEMKVVRHQAPREQLDVNPCLRRLHQSHENGVVVIGVENGRPRVATCDDVRAEPRQLGTR
jgi:hypothetical protein